VSRCRGEEKVNRITAREIVHRILSELEQDELFKEPGSDYEYHRLRERLEEICIEADS